MPTLDWLFYPDMFKLKKSQKHLEPYSFVRPTIRQKLEAMKVLLLSLAKQQEPKSELDQERDKQTPEHGECFQHEGDEDGPSSDLTNGI